MKGDSMYNVDQLVQELERYQIFIKPPTIKNYESKFLVSKSKEGLYPTEALFEFVASYTLIHRRFMKLDCVRVATARNIVLSGNADHGVRKYELPREWEKLYNWAKVKYGRRLENAEGSLSQEDSMGEVSSDVPDVDTP